MSAPDAGPARPPGLYCPITDAVHPAAAELNTATTTWMMDFGLFHDENQRRRLLTLGPGELLARVVPTGDVEALGPVVDFHSWLFAFDDAYCDEVDPGRPPADLAALLAGLLRIVEDPGCTTLAGNPFAEALRDVRTRLAAVASPRQIARWTEAVRAYFFHQLWEADNRFARRRLTLDEYTVLRVHGGAVPCSIMLLDVAEGEEVPQRVLDTPVLRSLVEMVSILVGWDNDIFSHHKESTRQAEQSNLMTVVGQTRRLGIDEALAQAVALRDRVMCRFLEVRDIAARDADGPTTSLLRNLGSWVHANIVFSQHSSRYPTGPGSPGGCRFTPMPASAHATVPDVVSWWWTPALTQRSGHSQPTSRLGTLAAQAAPLRG
ncbi:terpene synthase family protein [Micromonospora marina]|uniref:terpene synthase family protein n=1 Tax=Micromonospora marina TaxID=307120 RepID=UPI0034558832